MYTKWLILVIVVRQCDIDNRSWYKQCNNIVSYEFLCIRRTCDYT